MYERKTAVRARFDTRFVAFHLLLEPLRFTPLALPSSPTRASHMWPRATAGSALRHEAYSATPPEIACTRHHHLTPHTSYLMHHFQKSSTTVPLPRMLAAVFNASSLGIIATTTPTPNYCHALGAMPCSPPSSPLRHRTVQTRVKGWGSEST
ncbi:hypothetical protein EJ03DRAFT_59047 [Teratosphaeria nubilosa]|uniref:Uncharacterized protein n=1 Tax=Teratosphaeria nubilosa TaxID=161662 RepID=A0A6G1KTS5_9PEZI|nr:hypothetical protein EJ03DRAFT_59047 [Teratosphaeria nubilosa]